MYVPRCIFSRWFNLRTILLQRLYVLNRLSLKSACIAIFLECWLYLTESTSGKCLDDISSKGSAVELSYMEDLNSKLAGFGKHLNGDISQMFKESTLAIFHHGRLGKAPW